MNAHDEKINHAIQFADQLQNNNHYAKDKISEKGAHINDRYEIAESRLIILRLLLL